MKLLNEYYRVARWKLFTSILFFNILIIWLSQQSLVNETVFFNTFSNQLSYDRSLELFNEMLKFSWTAYLLAPVLLLIKFSTISMILYIGVYFSDLHDKVTLGKIFNIVIASEAVFIIASIVKLLWFIFFAGNYTMNDLNFFYPLSLVNLFRQSELETFWVYPMQTINLFQIIYVFVLAYGLSGLCSLKRDKAEKIVLLTYIPAVAIWIVFVMFLTIDAQI